jgi:hypothetical protein
LQAARVAGIRKDLEAVFTLSSLLKIPSPRYGARQRLIALGKIGGPIAVASLMA